MKIVGIALVWVGGLYLLQNLGMIAPIGWSVVWPVVIIIAGISLKHCRHSMMCGMGGKCGMCGTGDNKKCEGAGCGECKK